MRALCGEPSGTLRRRAPFQAYFQQGLAAYPELRFELLRVLTGVDSMLLYYRSVNGLLAAEMMTFNGEGERVSVRVRYVKEWGDGDKPKTSRWPEFADSGPSTSGPESAQASYSTVNSEVIPCAKCGFPVAGSGKKQISP